MKKILLLFVITISIFSVTAQSSKNRAADNLQLKSSQHTSDIASVEGFIDNITVYPNPVVEELKIAFQSSQRGLAVVSFFNNIGKPVFKQESEVESGHNIISIDIRSKSIEPGVYFIQLVSEGQTITRKLIVK
ncbi:MAG: T9SS type A sorting domain-containing protein [Bacteroidales bacterium]|nr:T9SS type A sorting domain-containing protein [Bacteroidales bacterium]